MDPVRIMFTAGIPGASGGRSAELMERSDGIEELIVFRSNLDGRLLPDEVEPETDYEFLLSESN